jgi:hypothetical protein
MEFKHLKRSAGRMELLCKLELWEQDAVMYGLEKLKGAGVETRFGDRALEIVYTALSKSIRRSIVQGISLAAKRLTAAQEALCALQQEAAAAGLSEADGINERISQCRKHVARFERTLQWRCAEKEARAAAREELAFTEPFAQTQVVAEMESLPAEPIDKEMPCLHLNAPSAAAPDLPPAAPGCVYCKAASQSALMPAAAVGHQPQTKAPAQARTHNNAPAQMQTRKKKLSKKKRKQLKEKEQRRAALLAKEEARLERLKAASLSG